LFSSLLSISSNCRLLITSPLGVGRITFLLISNFNLITKKIPLKKKKRKKNPFTKKIKINSPSKKKVINQSTSKKSKKKKVINLMKITTTTNLLITLIITTTQTYQKEVECEAFISALNKIRENPSSFIPYLQKNWLAQTPPSTHIHKINLHKYKKSTHSYHETINFLKNQKPKKALKIYKKLCKAANYHSYVMMNDKKLGHLDENEKSISKWISHYGKTKIVGESVIIVPEFWSDEKKILGEFLIDDRVFEKRNRKLIFSEKFDSVGFGARELDGAVYATLVYGSEFVEVKDGKKGTDSGSFRVGVSFLTVFLVGFLGFWRLGN